VLRQRQHGIAQPVDGFGSFKSLEDRLGSSGLCCVMSIPVVISSRSIRSIAVTGFFDKRYVAALFRLQFPYMVSRNAVQESSRRSLFFIEFPGLPDQRKECLLHNVRSGLRPTSHVYGVAIDPALMPAVELQKRAFITG
jgi:hypothetical protein